MSKKITTVIIFKIESTFEEWVKTFDSKGAELRHFELNFESLFRVFSKNYSKKYFCLNQSLVGNIKKYFQTIIKWIKNHKVYFSNMEESNRI